MVNIRKIHLRIHDKYSSTIFKTRLPAEYHGNNTLNIIIFPLNVLLGFVAQWSSSRPSVKTVHVRLSAKLRNCVIIIRSGGRGGGGGG